MREFLYFYKRSYTNDISVWVNTLRTCSFYKAAFRGSGAFRIHVSVSLGFKTQHTGATNTRNMLRGNVGTFNRANAFLYYYI